MKPHGNKSTFSDTPSQNQPWPYTKSANKKKQIGAKQNQFRIESDYLYLFRMQW